MQAKVLTPSIFIAHEPQTPWAHDLLNVSDGSISFLILNKISKTFGPQLSISTSKVSILGFCPLDGSHLYTFTFFRFFEFVLFPLFLFQSVLFVAKA